VSPVPVQSRADAFSVWPPRIKPIYAHVLIAGVPSAAIAGTSIMESAAVVQRHFRNFRKLSVASSLAATKAIKTIDPHGGVHSAVQGRVCSRNLFME
jgi:hypothetical protein